MEKWKKTDCGYKAVGTQFGKACEKIFMLSCDCGFKVEDVEEDELDIYKYCPNCGERRIYEKG